MGLRFAVAKGVARSLHWGLAHVARRPGANLPGKVALKLDPQAIAEARGVLRHGAVMVTGTNGKTTVNNLLADCVDQAGMSACCNRTGANLAYGVASALLDCRGADWGVIESDELWLGKSLPALQPRFLVLLNLFRDQLDRCGEIDHIQDVIVEALGKSPGTALIYNADDPLCAMVALRAAELPGREGAASIAFGVAEPMHLEQNAVSDTTMCQRCSAMMDYSWRQYGQLGVYRCPECGFARPSLNASAADVRFTPDGLRFTVNIDSAVLAAADPATSAPLSSASVENVSRETSLIGNSANAATEAPAIDDATTEVAAASASCPSAFTENVSRETSKPGNPTNLAADAPVISFDVSTHLAGSYMVYNMLAVATAATAIGCAPADIQAAIDAFDPHNGRLQEFQVGKHRTLLNLAKNPTGFNQNLRIVVQRAKAASWVPIEDSASVATDTDIYEEAGTANRPEAGGSATCGIAFFINDRDVDGHDISWIWDIDFEELQRLPGARVFAGGERKHDLQVRLKYAGIAAELIDSMTDVFAAMAREGMPANADAYAIANYTALAPVRAELEELQAHPPTPSVAPTSCGSESVSDTVNLVPASNPTPVSSPPANPAPVSLTFRSEVISTDAQRTNVSRETFDDQNSHIFKTSAAQPVVIAHMFPDLLNLYGDGGSVRILEQRLRWRGIPVEVRRVEHGQTVDLSEVDLLFLGGGPDREQTLAAEQLMGMRNDIVRYVEDGGPVLAICGGYQILGRTWLSPQGEEPGLGVLDIETRRAGSSTDRLIDNIALDSPTAIHPVIGYENHASRTYLGSNVQPFGHVVSRTGHGNNDVDQADGALYRNVLGTYLHGTLLAKNPEVADWVLERALAHNALRTGAPTPVLEPLDDVEELAANAAMAEKLIPKGVTMGERKRLERMKSENNALAGDGGSRQQSHESADGRQ